MDAFAVFKIVMGVVISIFVLIMIYNFATSFLDIDASKDETLELRTFEQGVRDVYVNGIPGNFSFEDDTYKAISVYRPPSLNTEHGNIDFGFVPVFLKKDRAISISRITNDIGWWKFDYIVSLPRTRIIFIPLTISQNVEDSITLLASSLPNTENVEPEITFGFGCSEETYFHLNKWKRDLFIRDIVPYIKTQIDYGSICSEYMDKDEIIVFVADELKDFDKGFFVVPSGSYHGHIYTNNSGVVKDYLYRDGMDLMAFVLGGKEFYYYKTDIYISQLKVAAHLKYDEIQLLQPHVTRSECMSILTSISSSLKSIYEFADEDYDDEISSLLLSEYIRKTVNLQKSLEDLGCD